MKKSLAAFLVPTVLLMTGSSLLGDGDGHTHKKPDATEVEEEIDVRTVTGEVIDITCYLRHDSKGEKHTKCAIFCANQGMPMGVLEDGTNKIYVIIPPGHEDPKRPIMPFLGKKVKIAAILYTMGGLTGLEVQEIAAVDG